MCFISQTKLNIHLARHEWAAMKWKMSAAQSLHSNITLKTALSKVDKFTTWCQTAMTDFLSVGLCNAVRDWQARRPLITDSLTQRSKLTTGAAYYILRQRNKDTTTSLLLKAQLEVQQSVQGEKHYRKTGSSTSLTQNRDVKSAKYVTNIYVKLTFVL